MTHSFESIYAAVTVPRTGSQGVNERLFRDILEFVLANSIAGIVANGATGEYCANSGSDLSKMLAICQETLRGRGEFLCCIGSEGLSSTLAIADLAMEKGAAGLLLAMPYFFPYSQDDLICYSATVAKSVKAPILLYNLPKFTTPLEPATAVNLISAVPNLIGIKDSSGSLDIFRALRGSGAIRFVGDDSALVPALDEAVCEGVISGVAGVIPELTRFLFLARENPAYATGVGLAHELIDQLSVFPTPWGLKLIAECRGLGPANFLLPLSESRAQQASEFRRWFQSWWPAAAAVLGAN